MTITKLEYRVKPVVRYIITRFAEEDSGMCAVGERGEFENPDQAWETAYALCKLEHEQYTDFDPGDERIIYPRHPGETEEAA